MDTLTAIITRRSVRNYTAEKLTLDSIKEVVQYGLYAPSAHNQQSRRYYIITKQEDYVFLGEVMEFGSMLPNAGGVVLACYDKDTVKSEEFVPQDMGASIENILLAAHEKGIGTVRLGLYPHENEMKKISEHFCLEKNIIPFALISLGKQEGGLPEKKLKEERIQVI